MNKDDNSCVNCEAGHECSSTLRKNSFIFTFHILINNSNSFARGKFYSSDDTKEECRKGFYSPGSATQCTSKFIINDSVCISSPDDVKSNFSLH